jgi:hypothetical protein
MLDSDWWCHKHPWSELMIGFWVAAPPLWFFYEYTRGVYCFDEFDATGGQHIYPNDIGEVRRILVPKAQRICPVYVDTRASVRLLIFT